MIDHSKCDHPRTSSARARCRRAQSGEPVKKRATPREVGGGGNGAPDNYGQTPRDKADECHKCGVEKIEFRGTDPVSGILLYVGPKCAWYIRRSEDFKVVG